MLARVEKMGDLFAPLLELKQKLPKLPGIGKGEAEAVAAGLEMAAQAQKTSTRKKNAAGSSKRASSAASKSAKSRRKI
jgi:hypothetical protein